MEVQRFEPIVDAGHPAVRSVGWYPLIWNFWQYHRLEQERLQTVTAEREARAEAAQARAEAEQALLKKRAAALADARVDQLYQEINNLTRISEQVMLRDQKSPPRMPANENDPADTAGAP